MPEFLVLLLMQVTVFSSVTALILMAVKQIFKCRIPPRIGAVLWVILLARLICPIFPESRISVYNYIPVGRDIMFSLTNDVSDELTAGEEQWRAENNPYVVHRAGDETAAEESAAENTDGHLSAGDSGALTVGEYIAEAAAGYTESEADLESAAALFNKAIIAVYLAGICISLTTALHAYSRAKKRALKSSEPCTDSELLGIYRRTAGQLGISEKKLPPLRCGPSAMLIGCRNAQISCRDDMDKREAEMVFAHELLHYKCLDNPIILFSTVVACLFWYNPLIWIVRSMLREDIEVLCDARTLEHCRIPRTEYAFMLCRASAYSELMGAGCQMSAGGRRLKNRLKTISAEKHRRFLPRIASAVLCAAIMMLCLTNPIVSQNSDYSGYIENYARLTDGDVRSMHLYSQETVSTYLQQISTLLGEWYGSDYSAAVGNGNLEKFKRICASADIIPKETSALIQLMRTGEPLTVKNCAVISDCVTRLLGSESDGVEYDVLPAMISAADMEEILLHLTEAEAEALLKCYNRGVDGADASFEMFYTEAMMDLIRSRISDEWAENKLVGFYCEYDIAEDDLSMFSPALRDVLRTLREDGSVYICDLRITAIEREILTEILGAAYAGQREDVYYLKKIEDGCTFDIAEKLIRRGEYSREDMLLGYAAIGEPAERAESGGYTFIRVREDLPEISGSVREAVRESAKRAYSLGLIDAENGVVDLTEKLSCGQGIALAYRLAAAMVPIN